MKLFNLKQARKLVAPSQPTVSDGSGRRKFIKNVGLFALSANPIAETFKSVPFKPFEIRFSSNHFAVLRQNVMAWSISGTQFENNYVIKFKEIKGGYLLEAGYLRFKNTQLSFSLKAKIFYEKREWQMQAIIPEFEIDETINFVDWLDGKTELVSGMMSNQIIKDINDVDKIFVSGGSSMKIDRNWNIEVDGKENISTILHGTHYHSDRAELSITKEVPELVELGQNTNSIGLTIRRFTGWSQFVSGLKFHDTNQLTVDQDIPDLNFIFSRSEDDDCQTILWVAEENGTLALLPEKQSGNVFVFEKYLYYSEYLKGKNPDFYLSGNLKSHGQWISNKLGAFNFINDDKVPVFEAFGTNSQITGHFFEPRMRAYQPYFSDAIALVSNYSHPQAVSINASNSEDITLPQDPVKLKKLPRESIDNISKMEIGFEEIKFVPKLALKIKFLRSEDLILLDFELHNFKFTTRGEAPYVELANPKEVGVVVVYFQSQHTLEEAFFETSKIISKDVPSASDNIVLPVRQIRAKKSWLVYELPVGHIGFQLNVEGLLDWSKFNLRVHPRAWIKVESFAVMPKPYEVGQMSGNISTVPMDAATKFLDRNPLHDSYAVALASNRKVRLQNENVYDKVVLDKIINPGKSFTLTPEFNLVKMNKVDLSVGPIPDTSTSIEAPALLYISPNQVSDFTHRIELEPHDKEERTTSKSARENQALGVTSSVFTPVKSEIFELWHSRMGTKLNNGKVVCYNLEKLQTIRALWAFDGIREWPNNQKDKLPRAWKSDRKNLPFMASLDADDRSKLVHETSNYDIPGYQPIAVPVKMLILTSLGAYIDWHVFLNVPKGPDTYLNIVEWEHRATLGRDHYVKIVKKAFLFPIGHRAVLVKITERKFNNATKAAVNRQRMFIVVLEKEVLYSRKDPANKFIPFPFQSIKINTPFTPDIDNPAESTIKEDSSSYNFFINVGKQPFKFDIVATDKEGIDHKIRIPLVFTEPGIASNMDDIPVVIKKYHENKAFTEIPVYGQKVAYAESLVEGDTLFETDTIVFGAQVYPATGTYDLKFHPMMQSSKIYMKQLEELTGSRKLAEISLEDDENSGMVFAKVKNAILDFSSGGTDKSGGFLSPNMTITGLSKLQGPIGGDIEDLKKLVFNASKFFEKLETSIPSAKIFGVIDLFSLFSLAQGDLGGTFDDMISAVNRIRSEIDDIKNEILYLENEAKETKENITAKMEGFKKDIADKVKELLGALNSNTPRIPNLKTYMTESAFYAEYKWNPELSSTDITIIPTLLNVQVTNPKTAMTISTQFIRPFDAALPTSLNGKARFESFGIDIKPLLLVKFNFMEFSYGSSQKTDVKVDIDANDPITFKGALSFVNSLQSIIPSTGFSDDGPYVDLKPNGITAGFNLSIPSVEVGILSISNISLGAAITLPFTGDPLLISFNFSTRENPFLLTVSCFGGGGYFLLVTSLDGIESVEAAFEFGASISLNVGVASGGVSVMGGFYFKIEKVTKAISNEQSVETSQVTLTGYIRINGRLSILGIITVSLEFYLALTAVIDMDTQKVQKVEGEASLKVKVEVLFFSKTVSVSVRREFAGADADPNFTTMVELDDWKQYCLAFAG